MGHFFTVSVSFILVSLFLIILISTYFFSQGGCSLGTFECGGDSICVPQRAMCNGHVDCPNGDDESFENCNDLHGSRLITDMVNASAGGKSKKCAPNEFQARLTNLYHCDLSRFCIVLKGLPPGCECRMDYWAYCKNLSLVAVPRGIEGIVKRLILANNSISTVTRRDFSHYKLHLIHLEGNGIEELPDYVFHDLVLLDKLLLINNKLKHISEFLFRGLTKLSMIYLQRNRISYIHPNTFRNLYSLKYLDLSDNLLANIIYRDGFPSVPNLIDLLLSKNGMQGLSGNEFFLTKSLRFLGLSGNELKFIEKYSFAAMANLSELDLSFNQLMALQPDIFASNSKLEKLYLAHNPMNTILKTWFPNNSNLISIDLRGLTIENMNADLFRDVRALRVVYFDKYYYCTFVPHVKVCVPKSDGVSTMNNMLGRSELRVLVWLVAVTSVLANLLVILRRYFTNKREENISHCRIVLNLADLLMGLYLFIIGAADMVFRGIYHEMSHEWLSSWTCNFAGAIAMLSSEVSMMVLVFMSIERFLHIALPYSGSKPLSDKISSCCLKIIWIIGFAIAFYPLVAYQRNSNGFYGTNSMCFPLHLDDPYFVGWKYSTFVFIVINSIGLCVMFALYLGMFISILQTRYNTSRPSAKGDYDFAMRFFVIVITNCACWLPIIVLKILAFHRLFLPSGVYAWIAIVVVPINSAFNPIIYTFTTHHFQEKIYKLILDFTTKLQPVHDKSVETTQSTPIAPPISEEAV